jgi:hypothetical protein
MRRMRLALAGVAALALLAAACGGGDEPEAAEANSADSARISIFVASTTSHVPFDASCSGIADWARRRSQLVCDYADNTSTEVIEIGRRAYERRVAQAGAAGRWTQSTPSENGALATSPAGLLETMRSATIREQQIGEEEVRCEPAVYHQLTVDRETAGLEDAPGETVVDIWVADGLLRRISYEDGGKRRTSEFFDYGVAVAVAAPAPSS